MYVGDILENIDIYKYNWSINQNDIIFESDISKTIGLSVLNGCQFKEVFAKEKYYILFLGLFAFERGTELVTIHSFKEFVKSDCSFCLLCCDNIVSFYSDNISIVKKIKENAERNRYMSIEYFTEITDYNRNTFNF